MNSNQQKNQGSYNNSLSNTQTQHGLNTRNYTRNNANVNSNTGFGNNQMNNREMSSLGHQQSTTSSTSPQPDIRMPQSSQSQPDIRMPPNSRSQPDIRMPQSSQSQQTYVNQSCFSNVLPMNNYKLQGNQSNRMISNQRTSYSTTYQQQQQQGPLAPPPQQQQQLVLLLNNYQHSNYQPNNFQPNPFIRGPAPYGYATTFFPHSSTGGPAMQSLPQQNCYQGPANPPAPPQPLPVREKKPVMIKDPTTQKVYNPIELANDQGKPEPESREAVETRAQFSTKVYQLAEQDSNKPSFAEHKHNIAAKEFIPEQYKNTEKPTPVVSAISDGAEVTISTKGSKERESPIKNQKSRSKLVPTSTGVSTTTTATTAANTTAAVSATTKEPSSSTIMPTVIASNVSATIEVAASKDTVKENVSSNSKKPLSKSDNVRVSETVLKVTETEVVIVKEGHRSVDVLHEPVIVAKEKVICDAKKNEISATSETLKSATAPVSLPSASVAQSSITTTVITTAMPVAAVHPVIVPESQPSKPTSKLNKMKDLNLKGAQLEGSDMDAFKFKDDEKKIESSMTSKKNHKKDKDTTTIIKNDILPPSKSAKTTSEPITTTATTTNKHLDTKVAPVPAIIKNKNQQIAAAALQPQPQSQPKQQKQKNQHANVPVAVVQNVKQTIGAVAKSANNKSSKSGQVKSKASSPPLPSKDAKDTKDKSKEKDKEKQPKSQKQAVHESKTKTMDQQPQPKTQKEKKDKDKDKEKDKDKQTAAKTVSSAPAPTPPTTQTESESVPQPPKKIVPVVPTQSSASKFDVTSIVTETTTMPPPKPVYQTISTSSQESYSPANATKPVIETDVFPKAFKSEKNSLVIFFDKLANAIYSYRGNHWCPWKTECAAQYTVEFLFEFQNDKRCQTSNLIRLEGSIDILRRGDTNTFNQYSSYSSMRMSLPQRGSITKRNSQQGGRNSSQKGVSSMHMLPKLSFSIELNNNIQFQTAENAWVPSKMKKGQSEADKNEYICKRVRSILNKLTPDNFEKLVAEAEKCNITEEESLINDICNIIYDKAITEPVFSTTYAKFCLRMSQTDQDSNQSDAKIFTFKKVLLGRCQREFEKKDDIYEDEQRKKIKSCTDPEKKRELQLEFDEKERLVRKKAVGSIKFIGELYKVGLLNGKIMKHCISNKLSEKQEHSLESLCKLVTTIGAKLETEGVELDKLFESLRELVVKSKKNKISSRVRFMIQDVIDLKNNGWKFVAPKLQAGQNNAKNMKSNEFYESSERINMTSAGSNSLSGSGQDKRRAKAGSNSMSGSISTSNSWQTVTKTKHTSYHTVQSSKFKSPTLNPVGMNLGTAMTFSSWSQGSGIKSFGTQNSSSAQFGGPSSTEKSSYSRPSQQSNEFKSEKPIPPPSRSDNVASKKPTETTKQPEVVVKTEAVKLNFEHIFNRILDDYMEDTTKEFFYLPETVKEITAEIDRADMDKYIYELIIFVLNKSKIDFNAMADILYILLKQKMLFATNVLNCLQTSITPTWADIKCDSPKAIDYLMMLLHLCIKNGLILLHEIKKACFDDLSPPDSYTMFVALIEQFRVNNSQIVLKSLWTESHLNVRDFVHESVLEKFQQSEQAVFLLNSITITADDHSNDRDLQNKFIELLKSDCDPYEKTIEWINQNCEPDVRKDVNILKLFIVAVCHCCVVPLKDEKGNFKFDGTVLCNQWKVVKKCFFHNHEEQFELVCLSAILHYMEQIQHPKGIWTDIFQELYNKDLISFDGFIAWKEKDESEPGKGVAIHTLLSFYNTLHNDETDDDELSKDANQ